MSRIKTEGRQWIFQNIPMQGHTVSETLAKDFHIRCELDGFTIDFTLYTMSPVWQIKILRGTKVCSVKDVNLPRGTRRALMIAKKELNDWFSKFDHIQIESDEAPEVLAVLKK